MSEEETQEEGKEEPEENPGDGGEPQTTELIDSANSAAERLEAAIKKQEELLVRQEKLAVIDKLGGRTSGGEAPEKPEETNAEYANKVMKNE